MTTEEFIIKNQILFEKIIKIVRRHDGNFVAIQDDIATTKLIMREIEAWDKGVSRITPLCSSIFFDIRTKR